MIQKKKRATAISAATLGTIAVGLLAAGPAQAAFQPSTPDDQLLQTWSAPCWQLKGSGPQPFAPIGFDALKIDAADHSALSGAQLQISDAHAGDARIPVNWTAGRDATAQELEAGVIAAASAAKTAHAAYLAAVAEWVKPVLDGESALRSAKAQHDTDLAASQAADARLAAAQARQAELEAISEADRTPEEADELDQLINSTIPSAEADAAHQRTRVETSAAAIVAAQTALDAVTAQRDAAVAGTLAEDAASREAFDAAVAALDDYNTADASIYRTTLTTGEDGTAITDPIRACATTGDPITFTVTEVAAPDGYVPLEHPVTVTVELSVQHGSETLPTGTVTSTDPRVTGTYSYDWRSGARVSLTVANEKTPETPAPVAPAPETKSAPPIVQG